MDARDGADAVASLDLLRFQAAALREAMPDADADGFVDAVDAFPNDPGAWSDLDGDGVAEAVDDDDDGDGVADREDAFPFDPEEWADVDGDGIGDNADHVVTDVGPLRDRALRAAVAAALGKAPDASITGSEIATLETLRGRNWGIRNLAGLELATGLNSLDLGNNAISDLSRLSALTALRTLRFDGNDIHDVSPLAGLADLETLDLRHNTVSDISPVARLTNLTSLKLDNNRIRDLSPLENLSELTTLTMNANAVRNLSPLAGLTQLVHLEASENAITDASPLSGLELKVLRMGYNSFASGGLRSLQFGERAILDLTGVRLANVFGLPNLANIRQLILRDNFISDVSRLAELTGVELLDLSANDVTDIGALLDRNIWRGPHPTSDARLRLDGNPLGRDALDHHIPTLRSWGVRVQLDHLPDRRRTVAIADPVLQTLIAETLAEDFRLVDQIVTEGTISRLKTLRATGAGLSDLTGLETARNLEYLFAASNGLTDLTPLAELPDLRGLDLSGNDIVDIGPLVDNLELRRGDWIVLDNNPLSEESVNVHIPALLERRVAVSFEGVRLGTSPSRDPVVFEVGGHFAAVLGDGLRIEAKVRDPALAHAEVARWPVGRAPGRVRRAGRRDGDRNGRGRAERDGDVLPEPTGCRVRLDLPGRGGSGAAGLPARHQPHPGRTNAAHQRLRHGRDGQGSRLAFDRPRQGRAAQLRRP